MVAFGEPKRSEDSQTKSARRVSAAKQRKGEGTIQRYESFLRPLTMTIEARVIG
jgi:hypothetical protein